MLLQVGTGSAVETNEEAALEERQTEVLLIIIIIEKVQYK